MCVGENNNSSNNLSFYGLFMCGHQLFYVLWWNIIKEMYYMFVSCLQVTLPARAFLKNIFLKRGKLTTKLFPVLWNGCDDVISSG